MVTHGYEWLLGAMSDRWSYSNFSMSKGGNKKSEKRNKLRNVCMSRQCNCVQRWQLVQYLSGNCSTFFFIRLDTLYDIIRCRLQEDSRDIADATSSFVSTLHIILHLR